jgi:hypothetical protein
VALESWIEQSGLSAGTNIGIEANIIGNVIITRFSRDGSGVSESGTSSRVVRIHTTEPGSALRVELNTFVVSVCMHRANVAGRYVSS